MVATDRIRVTGEAFEVWKGLNAAAFSVQRNLPGSDYFQDSRTDGSVDVILSQDYTALAPPLHSTRMPSPTPGSRVAWVL